MSRYILWIFVALLASVPLWLTDYYVLHILITTGIFIIAAMSLNLLLGYTGQLSLGHVAFFGIGAYTSALISLGFEVHLLPEFAVGLDPKPVWLAMLIAVVVAGLTGWAIGKLSFRVRGAYFVIVSISFAEVVRLVALNWVELTQGPMALNNIPALTLGVGEFTLSFLRKPAFYCLVLATAVVLRGTRWGKLKPLAIAWYFAMVTTAALVAVYSLARGRRVYRWEPERHQVRSPSPTRECAEITWS